MNTDIRVDIAFFGHRKTRKLIKKFGLEAAWGLLQLWAFAARSKPDGYLTNMSDEDIAMECHVDEKVDPVEFAAYLKSEDCRWIDDTENGLYLHDWHVHNPWAAGSEDRSDKARFSRMAQTHPLIFKQLLSKGVTAVTRSEYASLTKPQRDVNETLAPSPSPVPSPSPKSKERAGGAKTSAFVLPEWIPQSAWDGYEEMRKAKKKVPTDRARELVVKELEKLKAKGHDPTACLEQSTRNGWTDVYELKNGGSGNAANQRNHKTDQPARDPDKYSGIGVRVEV